MAKELKCTSKIKLLKLMELLRQETDEDHPMSRTVVCERLNNMGIPCEPRTLATDIDALNQFGFEVMIDYVNHEKFYYVSDRSFSAPELKIIIDAIQAASFVTQKKSAELIEKVAALGGSYQAELLRGNMVCFNTRKHNNENVLLNVMYIDEAIRKKKRVSFYYFDLNEKGERVFRKDKWRYTADPLAMVYSEDNYYLMTYHTHKDSIVNYRIDRMTEVKVEDKDISEDAQKLLARKHCGIIARSQTFGW